MAPERTNPAVLLPTSKLPTCWKSAGLCSCGTRGTQNSEAVVEIGVGEPLPFVGGGLVGCGGCGGCLLEVVGGGGKASFVGGVVGGVVGFVVAGAGAGGKLGGAGAGGHPVGEETNIVGDSVGDRVGAKVVGAVVGNRVGAVVGDRVGAKVVGDTVGDWVGAKDVGDRVSTLLQSSPTNPSSQRHTTLPSWRAKTCVWLKHSPRAEHRFGH
mmetsp:Transcript_20860/g.41333  ORF Transcript_20860/g.41333 Transcript_20860/m.41333 type:complete len:211 (-) Transcript_20860:264-896(-)